MLSKVYYIGIEMFWLAIFLPLLSIFLHFSVNLKFHQSSSKYCQNFHGE